MAFFSRHRSYTEKVLAARARRRSALRVLVVLAVTASFHAFVLRSYRIASDSMAPCIPKSSIVLASPILGGRGANPRIPPIPQYGRGDIVIVQAIPGSKPGFLARAVQSALGFLSFQRIRPDREEDSRRMRPGLYRIIGIPGDSLRSDGFTYEVKPAGSVSFSSEYALSRREYSVSGTSGRSSRLFADSGGEVVELGDDEYFVACDDRSVLDGSPLFGPLPRSRIAGRLLALYWPLKSARLL